MHAASEAHHVADECGEEGKGCRLERGEGDTDQPQQRKSARRKKADEGDEIDPVRTADKGGVGEPKQRAQATLGELNGRKLPSQGPRRCLTNCARRCGSHPCSAILPPEQPWSPAD